MYDLCELFKSVIESYSPLPLLSRGKGWSFYGVKDVEMCLALDCAPMLITHALVTKDMNEALCFLHPCEILSMCVCIGADNEQLVVTCHDIPLLSLSKGSKTQSNC